MTEFYHELSEEEIENLISFKMRIYDDKFDYLRYDKIKIPERDFIFDHYFKFQGLNRENYELFKHIGIKNGNDLYHFYNVKIKRESRFKA